MCVMYVRKLVVNFIVSISIKNLHTEELSYMCPI